MGKKLFFSFLLSIVFLFLTSTVSWARVASDPVIAAVGDMVCGKDSTGAECKEMEVSDLVLLLNPQAFLALGDVQYEDGEYDDFLNFYEPSFGRVRGITRPAIGNHEYNDPTASDPTEVGYWDYFNGIGNFTGPAGDRDKGYYSFDLGEWHVIALNSNCSKVGGCGEGSPQETWLRADLATNPTSCTLAYFHQPLYSSGGRASTRVRALWQALYDYSADVVLAATTIHENGLRHRMLMATLTNQTLFVSSLWAPEGEITPTWPRLLPTATFSTIQALVN